MALSSTRLVRHRHRLAGLAAGLAVFVGLLGSSGVTATPLAAGSAGFLDLVTTNAPSASVIRVDIRPDSLQTLGSVTTPGGTLNEVRLALAPDVTSAEVANLMATTIYARADVKTLQSQSTGAQTVTLESLPNARVVSVDWSDDGSASAPKVTVTLGYASSPTPSATWDLPQASTGAAPTPTPAP
jgi:hypothetical protein